MTSLKDRYREYAEQKPKVVLMVNDKAACNLNCKCCYLPYEGIRDSESAMRVVKNMRDKYRIAIAGSELLVDPRYLEVLKEAGQKYILTNGLLLQKEPEFFDALRQYGIEEIQLSMDYKGQKQGGGGMSLIVEEAVKNAKERDFYVRLACIITPENFMEVEQICAQASEMGADAMFLIRYLKSGSASDETTKTLAQGQREDFFGLVDEVRQQYSKDEFEIRVNGNFGPKKGSKGETLAKDNRYCYAGSNIFSIDPADNVYGCPFLMDTTPIGKLVDESRLEINRNLCNGDRSKCITDLVYR